MIERLNQDIKEAMKSKDKDKLSAIRYLKSMLMENKTSKRPRDEMDVVIAHVKKLKDSVDIYPEGNPQKEAIKKEIEILNAYMPKQMNEDDVKKLIKEIITTLDEPNMGGVMKELSPRIKGKFDGKLANQFVREALK